MNKTDLIDALYEETNLSVKTAESIVKTILDSMTNTLVAGDNIELRGFGSFTVKKYKPYTGRNPKTGQEIKVQPKKLPFFKVGKELKETVNAGRK